MNVYFRWGGGAVLLVAAALVGREYTAYTERRISECEGFLSLLSHIEGKISKYLSFGDGLWRDFSDAELERVGFLPALREGLTASEAFSRCNARLSLGDDVRERLGAFFEDFGKEYMEGELKRLRLFREELAKIHAAECVELRKNAKVVRTLLIGAALGALILLI